MIDRNVFREVDWYLIGLLLLNAALGCLFIYSAAHDQPGQVYLKQISWLGLSCLALFLILLIDYKILITYSPAFYVLGLIALTALFAFGKIAGGAKSWYQLGFMGVQPSEIMKVILVLVLARIFAEYNRSKVSVIRAAASAGVTLLPMALVSLQPDIGTAFTYVPLLLSALYLAGLGRKTVVVLVLVSLAGGFFGWNFVLKDYQKKRILTLVTPSLDRQGAGYQIAQSKIAIGSGGLLGKGLKKGTQSQLRFLPARHTDFIFSVLGEEFGFVGIAAAMAVYFALIFRLFQSIGKARDRSGIYIIFMVVVLLTFQFLVNVLMVVGLFPVTGIPLPFFSYGGSSLLSSFLAVGLALNVKMRRFANV